jgi:hypothetical protein
MVLYVKGVPQHGYRIQYRNMTNGRWVKRLFAEENPQFCRAEWNRIPHRFR